MYSETGQLYLSLTPYLTPISLLVYHYPYTSVSIDVESSLDALWVTSTFFR